MHVLHLTVTQSDALRERTQHAVLAAVPGFQDAIREYVVHSIGITFRRVSMRVLADWLRLEPPALKQLLADKVGGVV